MLKSWYQRNGFEVDTLVAAAAVGAGGVILGYLAPMAVAAVWCIGWWTAFVAVIMPKSALFQAVLAEVEARLDRKK